MQYIVVRFPTKRTVFIDGTEAGFTGKTLRIESGKHRIHLGAPANYEPKYRRPKVTGTTSIKPMEVVFEKTT